MLVTNQEYNIIATPDQPTYVLSVLLRTSKRLAWGSCGRLLSAYFSHQFTHE
jgi:hypothetical protein